MSHILERAPTGRARCRACSALIAAGDWRLGERLPNPYADADGAEMTHWFHVACAAFRRPEPFVAALASATDQGLVLDDRDRLEHEARLGLVHRRLSRVDAAQRAPSSRALCRACKEKIEQGTWRIGLVWYEDSRFTPAGYIHVACAHVYLETIDLLPRIRHWSKTLSPDEVGELEALLIAQRNA